ncbi:hypothetical protein BpHYR1_024531 [Brachionus plicatilis]|uniref:Uncharacterized protein n=1 Tax=Brachionus plicatilis TaxID=10195 RepID=A0A3M7RAP5_BRAPC|nr:hypothetical protein BpHYR1_024531 [Brachionus plicatilis]
MKKQELSKSALSMRPGQLQSDFARKRFCFIAGDFGQFMKHLSIFKGKQQNFLINFLTRAKFTSILGFNLNTKNLGSGLIYIIKCKKNENV